MQIGSWIAVYFIAWWICLFAVLPFGARSQRDAGDVVRGSEPGAPAAFRVMPKVLATTVLAGVVTALVVWGFNSDLLRAYMR
jgi:predicted secreted protein